MDEEQEVGSGRKRHLWWLLVILAVVLIWWLWKPGKDNGDHAAAGLSATDLAAADPDDILVDFVDDASDERVRAVERELGITLTLVSRQSRDERFYRAHVDPARRDQLLAALARLPGIETAEPDAEVSLLPQEVSEAPPFDSRWKDFPNDPLYKFQWHMGQIHMPAAWKLSSGKGVVVAVIDTGVAYESYRRFHPVPDLAKVNFAKGYNFVDDNPHAADDHGHGTHVAGTIAQSTHNGVGVTGIAREATIMPLKVLSAHGSGSVAAIADAIRFAADNGAKVINMSLGGRFRSRILERAVKYAHDKGVVVVCAAGNDGSGRVSYPAAYPGAVAVAATQLDEATTFYSNWGPQIDVAAPGGNTQEDRNRDGMPDGVVQNTIVVGDPSRDGYFAFMGTSMASPHVAGVAALIVGEGVTDPDAVEKILKDSARKPKGKSYDKKRYGAGIIDAEAAVRKARGAGGAWSLGLALILGGAVAASARRRSAILSAASPGMIGGLVIGASGLFFLPYLGGLGASASSLPVVDTLTRGFPSWDLAVLGPGGHGNVIFFSALVPLVFLSLVHGMPRLRGVAAGFALGVAAHLLFHMVAGTTDIRYAPSFLMGDQLWLALNALLCVALAHLAIRK